MHSRTLAPTLLPRARAQPVELNAVHANPARPWLFAVGGGDACAWVYDVRHMQPAAGGGTAGAGRQRVVGAGAVLWRCWQWALRLHKCAGRQRRQAAVAAAAAIAGPRARARQKAIGQTSRGSRHTHTRTCTRTCTRARPAARRWLSCARATCAPGPTTSRACGTAAPGRCWPRTMTRCARAPCLCFLLAIGSGGYVQR